MRLDVYVCVCMCVYNFVSVVMQISLRLHCMGVCFVVCAYSISVRVCLLMYVCLCVFMRAIGSMI